MQAMLLKDLAWREEEGISDLAAKNISEVLECSEESAQAVVEMFPSFVYGHDKDGQSLMFRHYGKFEIWKILEHTTLDNLLRLHVWENEQALQGMRQFARDSGNSIETFCAVVDAEGWRLGLATSDAMRYIKGMVNVDSDHYPERLGRMILINLPSMLLTVWSVIKRWLPPRTQDKIQLLGSRKDWEPVLRRYIDDKYIPEIYGGTGPNNEHEALERMHGKIGDASDAHGLHGGREEEEKTPLEASPDLSKKPPRDEQSCTQGSEPNEQPTESKWFVPSLAFDLVWHLQSFPCLRGSRFCTGFTWKRKSVLPKASRRRAQCRRSSGNSVSAPAGKIRTFPGRARTLPFPFLAGAGVGGGGKQGPSTDPDKMQLLAIVPSQQGATFEGKAPSDIPIS
eukprot:scaffold349_cov244-Pinguiococcus_pyrenoidosus.AAC.2